MAINTLWGCFDVALICREQKQPVTAADVAKGFARVRAADVEEILETLCTMGHARRGQGEGTFLP